MQCNAAKEQEGTLLKASMEGVNEKLKSFHRSAEQTRIDLQAKNKALSLLIELITKRVSSLFLLFFSSPYASSVFVSCVVCCFFFFFFCADWTVLCVLRVVCLCV